MAAGVLFRAQNRQSHQFVAVDQCVGAPSADSPMIDVEYFDQPQAASLRTKIGYVVVEMQGSKAAATYKAEAAPGVGFVPQDSWSWKVADGDTQ
jgi:hypothetical protein